MSEKNKKIMEVLTNESLRKDFESCTDSQDVLNLLAQNGVEETTREELLEVFRAATGKEGELKEEQLDLVAGGGFWEILCRILRGNPHMW